MSEHYADAAAAIEAVLLEHDRTVQRLQRETLARIAAIADPVGRDDDVIDAEIVEPDDDIVRVRITGCSCDDRDHRGVHANLDLEERKLRVGSAAMLALEKHTWEVIDDEVDHDVGDLIGRIDDSRQPAFRLLQRIRVTRCHHPSGPSHVGPGWTVEQLANGHRAILLDDSVRREATLEGIILDRHTYEVIV